MPSNSGASPGATSIGSVCGGALGRKRSHTQTRSREGRQPLPARTREVRMAHIGPGAQRADSVQRIGRQYRPNRLIALGHGRRIKACDKARESCAHRSGWRRSLAWHRSAPWRPLASCWRFSRVVASSRARPLRKRPATPVPNPSCRGACRVSDRRRTRRYGNWPTIHKNLLDKCLARTWRWRRRPPARWHGSCFSAHDTSP